MRLCRDPFQKLIWYIRAYCWGNTRWAEWHDLWRQPGLMNKFLSIKIQICIKFRVRMTIITWELLKWCPVRRRGWGSLMLCDVEVRNVDWKCHLENPLFFNFAQWNAIQCDGLPNVFFLNMNTTWKVSDAMLKSGISTRNFTRGNT